MAPKTPLDVSDDSECHPDHQNASQVPQSTEEVAWERMCECADEAQQVENDDKAE